MRVKFFAYLRDYTGCTETEVPAADTMGELACILGERFGSKLRDKILTAEGELGPETIIMINGRHVAHLGGLNAPLKSEDTVQIFPLVAGG